MERTKTSSWQVYGKCPDCPEYDLANSEGEVHVGGVCPSCGTERALREKVVARRIVTGLSVWWKPRTWFDCSVAYEAQREYFSQEKGWK